MKKWENLAYLKNTHFNLFLQTRQRVKSELSDGQSMFCCCGKLATGLHEDHCKKFNEKVDTEVIKRLEHLLPKKGVSNEKE